MAYVAPNISLISPISTNSNGSAIWACGACVTDIDLNAYSSPVSVLTGECTGSSNANPNPKANKTEPVEYWLCACLQKNPIIEKKCSTCPRMKPSSSIPINYGKK